MFVCIPPWFDGSLKKTSLLFGSLNIDVHVALPSTCEGIDEEPTGRRFSSGWFGGTRAYLEVLQH